MPDPKTNPNPNPDPTSEELAAAAAAAAEGAAPAGEGEVEVYTETVDLGNGKTKTFEADSQEALREKIFSYIREKETAAPPAAAAEPGDGKPVAPAAPAKRTRKDLSQDESFRIDQEFKNGSPLKGLNDFVLARYGRTLDEIIDDAENGGNLSRNTDRAGREAAAVDRFKAKHPEFTPSPSNRAAFDLYLQGRGLEATEENLEAAYTDLQAQGLVVNKKEDPANPNPANPNPAGGNPPPKKKVVASSLAFGKPGAGPRPNNPGKKKVLTDAEMQNLAKQGSDKLLEALQDQFEEANAS